MKDNEPEKNEEIIEIIEEVDLDSTADDNSQDQPTNREQVDQIIDGTNTKILEDLGVPEPFAKKAVKSNGGPLSPTNLPANKIANNSGRNALANSPLFNKQNQNDSNRLQQALNKKETGINQFNQNRIQNNEQEETSQSNTGMGGGVGNLVSSKISLSVKSKSISKEKIVAEASKVLLKKKVIIGVSIGVAVFLIIFMLIIAVTSMDSDASSNESSESTGGMCHYQLAAKKGQDVSDVKVRLLKCSTNNTEKEGEPIDGNLIDFEDYILGVVNQEIGSDAPVEAIKAQAIAARSYSLTRLNGTRLKKENGQWILEMKACTDDQAYCDPYKGCHSKCDLPKIDNTCGAGGNGGSCHSTLYPGNKSNRFHQCYNGYWNHAPASQKVIDAVKETAGQVALSGRGNVAATDYASTETAQFRTLADQGLNAFEIIKKMYGDRASVKSVMDNCEAGASTGVTGPFTNWKQCNESWSENFLGTSKTTTICDAGCAATSIAIQLAKSGANLTFNNLNPGTFVKEYTKVGGFSGALIYFGNINKVAPNFKHVGSDRVYVSGTKQQKVNQLNRYANNGEYLVIGIYKNATTNKVGHWVAFDHATGDTVYINDPGQRNLGNKLFDIYPYTVTRNIVVHRYKLSN